MILITIAIICIAGLGLMFWWMNKPRRTNLAHPFKEFYHDQLVENNSIQVKSYTPDNIRFKKNKFKI